MFRVVTSVEELAVEPIGTAMFGSSFLTWCATDRLVGTVHFGRRDSVDAATLTQLYGFATHRAFRRPLLRVVDGRELSDIDEAAWTRMSASVNRLADSLRGLFERQAVIIRPDLDGAKTVALLPAFGPSDEFRVFADVREAYAWADPDHGLEALARVTALLATHESVGLEIEKVRTWIARNLRDARIDRCARALGTSARSLQRGLARAGANFRALVVEQRVAVARKRLVEENTKIDVIAREVGCSSSSQLGVLLRRAGMDTPSNIRASRRKAP